MNIKLSKFRILSLIVLLTLTLSLIFPTVAFADDGPATPEPTAEPVATDPPVAEEPVDEVLTTEEPVTDEPVDPQATEVPVDTSSDESSVAEAVQALADADAVLVDENGIPIPLASEEAAEILSTGDPSGTLDNAVATVYGLAPGATFAYFQSDDTHLDGTCTTAVSSVTCYWDTPLQKSVDDAAAGSIVLVEAGTYIEQIVIGKSLSLVGAGAGTTIIQAPAVLVADSDGAYSIVSITGATTLAEFAGFTVQGPVDGLNFGIYVKGGASADIHDNVIQHITNDPFDGSQNGVAIEVGWDAKLQTGTADIEINVIRDYQKNGITVSRVGSSANITGNTVTGAGPTTTIAQNGIQVSNGATATITGNTVTGNYWTLNDSWTSTGMLLYNAGSGVVVDGNTVDNNQINIYAYNSNNVTIRNNSILNASEWDGLDLYNVNGATVTRNLFSGSSYDGIWIGGGSTANLTITNNQFLNNGNGIPAAGDPAAGGVHVMGGTLATMAITGNSFSGNKMGVSNDTGGGMLNASGNWWGSNAPAGVSGSVFGSVDYTPWLNSGTDTNLVTPGFQGDFSFLNVDDNSPQTGTTGRIQEGVNLVSGSTVNVMPGTYTEQVVIDGKDVTLQAAAPGVTIQAPASVPTCFTTPSVNKPIICAKNANNVFINGLTIDGLGLGNANYRFEGIAFYNAGGTISNNTIRNITDSPLSGSQHGVALYGYNQDGSPRTLTVTGNTITNYQKNGMALSGDGLTATVQNNTVTGAGPTNQIAQNGIQISYGAVGTISGNTVSGNFWTGTYGGSNDPTSDPNADGAAGILVYDPGTATIQIFGNNVFANQFGIASVGATDLNIHDNTIQGTAHTGSGYPVGIAVWDSDQWSETEFGTTGSVQNNTITQNDYGVLIFDTPGEVSPNIGVHNNSITANTLYGAWSNTFTNATNNWWGNASGPLDNTPVPDDCALVLDNPGGLGNKVSQCVDYGSWLTTWPYVAPTTGTNGGSISETGGPAVSPVVIPVTGGQEVVIPCDQPSITFSVEGIEVTFTGLCGYSVVLEPVAEESLPGDLGEGNTFAAGISIVLTQNGASVETLPPGTSIRVSYARPSGAEADLMVWNGTSWDEIEYDETDTTVSGELSGPGSIVMVTH